MARKAVCANTIYFNLQNSPNLGLLAINMDRLQVGRTSHELTLFPAGLFQENGQGLSHTGPVEGGLLGMDQGLNPGQPLGDHASSGTWSGSSAAGVPGRGEYLKE